MSEWEKQFAYALDQLTAFQAGETEWLRGLGDPRFYHSDRDVPFDSYVAVFPQVPEELQQLLTRSYRAAATGLDAVSHALTAKGATASDKAGFPFASSRAEFLTMAQGPHLQRFAPHVRDALIDLAPYPGGDDPLHALHVLAASGSGPALAPYARVPADDPPRAGALTLSKECKGKLVKEPLSSADQLDIPTAACAWDPVIAKLTIARWSRRPNVHVEARVHAWIIFESSGPNPALARGKAAYSTSRDLIARAAQLTRDLAQFI